MSVKKLRWPKNKQEHAVMREREFVNLARAKINPNENWMLAKLKQTPHKWRRQTRWGYRIFDFWCHRLGLAVEVDGPEHNQAYDSYRDQSVLENYGVLVVRVRNKNEGDAQIALARIKETETWNQRRAKYGLHVTKNGG